MTLVIGMDEAGYGPNLGPLAIGLSAWQVGGQRPEASNAQAKADLFRLLEESVCNKPDGKRVAIADSKVLYKPGGGLGHLERGVLATLALCSETQAQCYETLIDALLADVERRGRQLPWHQQVFNASVPVDCNRSELADVAESLSAGDARLCMLRGRLVHPAEFNAECQRYDSKGLALSHWSLKLLQETLIQFSLDSSPQPPAPIYITCDKHGGRNKYTELLSEYFPDYSLRVIVESRPRSAYVLCRDDATIEIEFRTKGESQLEAALASMVAKYLRELSMQAFNAFWLSHLPALKPTAGYPMDAKRFKADIEAKQQELGIADDLLWRER